MHVHRSASGIEVLAPAKLNLFLEVLAKRSDGFHEIETLMVPIGWYDIALISRPIRRRISLACEQVTQSSDPVPTGDDNLVVRAVKLLRDRSGTSQGARLRLVKRIPAASGLAGGSSDAAAALVAANLGWQLNWPREQLASLAAELGSDVPFFLGRGPAICRGRGEIMEPVAGIGAAMVCRRTASRRTFDSGRVSGLPSGRRTAPRRAARSLSASGRFGGRRRPFSQRLADRRRRAMRVDRSLETNIGGFRLPGSSDERQRERVFWSLSSRPPCTTHCSQLKESRRRPGLRCWRWYLIRLDSRRTAVQITEVRIKLMEEAGERLQAFLFDHIRRLLRDSRPENHRRDQRAVCGHA